MKFVYGDNAVILKTVNKWYERFKSKKYSRRPLTSKTKEIVQIVRSNYSRAYQRP